MKLLLLTLACALALNAEAKPDGVLTDSAWRADVKTVQLYRSDRELEPPLLLMGGRDRLTLEFDVLGTEGESLRWRIVHCDRHWSADDLDATEFLTGPAEGPVDDYNFSFTTLTDYVHYSTTLPGEWSEFTHSGNYVAVVEDEEGRRLLTRRFCVTEQSVGVRAEVTRPYDGVDVARRQEVDVTVDCGMLGSEQWLTVVAQQNGRWDNLRELPVGGYEGGRVAFRRKQENIFDGGNTFRFFDCSNLHTPMYNVVRVEEYGGEQFVLLRPDEDRSRKHFLGEKTLSGGMKVNTQERDDVRLQSEYVWVNFSLPMAQPMLEGSVYVVGALTDWRMDSTSQMDYNPEYRAYTKRLLLKQGYYSYQLLVAGGRRQMSATATLEGDHYETPNQYTVYLYWHSPSDRADRLVAVQRVSAP